MLTVEMPTSRALQSAIGSRQLKIASLHSNSALMENSCADASYSTRSTFGLQQT
jgi:hypothetical protein